jgi:glycosyltransferase involved in cell wall biosynthesis
MKVYFYHTQNIQMILRQWKDGSFPCHFLYGVTYFKDNGVDVIFHKSAHITKRWKLSLYTAWQILTCHEHFDAVYATSFRGIEIIVLLRALNLFHHPIIIWHHQPIAKAKNRVREFFSKIFYRGFDHMFFFSEKLINDSLLSSKAYREHMSVANWGADLDFYNNIFNKKNILERSGFISTGKERRDMSTLIKAFNITQLPIDIYIDHNTGGVNYDQVFAQLEIKSNVNIHFINRLMPGELSKMVNKAACIVICCKKTNYTVGLTTVVEALALGIPMVCSRNPQIPINIDKEGCGITVEYGDLDGWINAITYISTHPDEAAEMGRKGRILAENIYNIKNCTQEILKVIKHINL